MNYVKLFAKCHVLTKEQGACGKPLRNDHEPNIYMNGNYGVCYALKIMNDDHIDVDHLDVIYINCELTKEDKESLAVGSQFELRNGPLVKWAECEVMEILPGG